MMVTKEQAEESLLRVLGKIPSTGAEYEDAAANLYQFVQQSQPVPEGYAYLPERLSRDQAKPLCVLEGSCERSGQCYGDCDCNPDAQVVWIELRTRLLAAAPKPGGES